MRNLRPIRRTRRKPVRDCIIPTILVKPAQYSGKRAEFYDSAMLFRSGRRVGDIETLRKETAAWSADVNSSQRGVDRQMKITDARCKLKHIHPEIES